MCIECGFKQCVCDYDPLLEDEEATDYIKLVPTEETPTLNETS